jgi:hypothetical protein
MRGKETRRMGTLPKWHRRIGASVGLAAVIGVALLFVGSVAAAPVTTAAASVTYRAPYSGTEDSNEFGLLSGTGGPICGVTESFPLAPFFNLTTGLASESVKATARSCGPGTSFASPEAMAGFVSANFTATSGAHHIKATWFLDLWVKLLATPGSPSQTADASFIITTQLYLIDLTNGSLFNSANSPYFTYGITSGAYSHHYSKIVLPLYLNATLVKTHLYEFGVFEYLNVYASVSPGVNSAYALANMGSGGRDAFLASVSGV